MVGPLPAKYKQCSVSFYDLPTGSIASALIPDVGCFGFGKLRQIFGIAGVGGFEASTLDNQAGKFGIIAPIFAFNGDFAFFGKIDLQHGVFVFSLIAFHEHIKPMDMRPIPNLGGAPGA